MELGPFPSGYRFPDFQNYSFARVSCAAVPISYVYFYFIFVCPEYANFLFACVHCSIGYLHVILFEKNVHDLLCFTHEVKG